MQASFKMWTGCWCVRLFSLFRVLRSEGTCLWMFRFHWRVDVPAGEDYLQAPCFCCSVERAVWHYLAHCDRLPCLSVIWRNVRYSYSAFLNYIRMCSNSCSLDRQENQIGICAGLFLGLRVMGHTWINYETCLLKMMKKKFWLSKMWLYFGLSF